jgi:antagonist of KipI
VVLGPQDDYFTDGAIDLFLSSTYIVSNQSDRTGYRLDGPKILHKAATDIISDGVAPGSIQILPTGNPVILFKDRHIGGYPKIAVAITVDQPKLAQMKPGDQIRFTAVSINEAHALLKRFE